MDKLKVHIAADGSFIVTGDRGSSARIGFVLPPTKKTSKSFTHAELKELRQASGNPSEWNLTGILEVNGQNLPFTAQFVRNGKELNFYFHFEYPAKSKIQMPLLRVETDATPLRGSLLGLTDFNLLLDGRKMEPQVTKKLSLPAFPLLIRRANQQGKLEIEYPKPEILRMDWAFGSRNERGKSLCLIEGRISSVAETLKETTQSKDDIWKSDRLQLLYPPREPLFNPAALIHELESKEVNTIRKTVENCLAARSRLLDLFTVQQYGEMASRLDGFPPPTEAETLLRAAYDKLNRLDHAGAEAMIPMIENALGDLRGRLPRAGGVFSPFSWVKSPRNFGFKDRDGSTRLEPSPFVAVYEDNSFIRLTEDPRVKTSVEIRGKTFQQVADYRKPMPEWLQKSSWIDTEWHNTKTGVVYRHSTLTPLFDMDNIDAVNMTLDAKIIQVEYLRDYCRPIWLRPNPKGVLKADFSQSGFSRPWLIVTDVNYRRRLVILGARPTELGVDGETLSIKLSRKSFISTLRLSDNLNVYDIKHLAELFTRISVVLPVAASEHVEGRRITNRYGYLERESDWPVRPLKIAPVPHLAQYGGLDIPGSVRTRQLHRYGGFSYVPGDTLIYDIPERFGTHKPVHGTNVLLKECPKALLEAKEFGAHRVRLCIGQNPGRDPELVYAETEAALKTAREHGIRILLDPHWFILKVVTWGEKEIAPESERRTRFMAMWERMSKIGAKYSDIIDGYELYNEIFVLPGAEHLWEDWMTEAGNIVRRNDPDKPIFVPALLAGQVYGLYSYEPPVALDRTVADFHFYIPGATFFPGQADKPPLWADRWSLGGYLLPALEFSVNHPEVPVHCGEFGVVNSVARLAPMTPLIWTRDTIDWLDSMRFDRDIWNEGFGMYNKTVRAFMIDLWKRNPVR